MKKTLLRLKLRLLITPQSSLSKTLLFTKITILFILLTTLQAVAGDANAQLVTIQMKQVLMPNVFKAIEKQSEFRFLYNYDLAALQKKISVNLEAKSVPTVLDNIFLGTGLTFKQLENNLIVIIPIESSESYEDRKITGTIKDDAGKVVSGASVYIKNKSTGTTTNALGQYTIIGEVGQTIVVQAVNYETLEVIIGNQKSFDFVLKSSISNLEEVIIVGYGTESKRNLTSAISSVKTRDLQAIPATSLSNLLGGRAPGVSVTTVGGRPGTTSSIRIRGASIGPFAGTTEPLYVIDNIIATKELFDLLDVNEVEEISFLKDAAATAVYGSRGSNGVVLTKTKTGVKGKPSFQFTGTFGTSSEVRQPIYTSAYEHALLINQSIKAGLDPLIPNSGQGTTLIPENQLQYLRDNPQPNFQDAVSITPQFKRYSMNTSGATDVVDYFISGNYADEGGTMPNLNYKKYGLRANVGVKLTDNLKLTMNANVGNDIDYQYYWPYDPESISDSYRQMGRRGNWVPSFINGLPVANFNAFSPADFALNNGNGTRTRKTNLTNSTLSLDYKVPFISGLSAGLTYNYRVLVNTNTTWQKPNVSYVFEADPNNPFKLTDKIVGTRTRVEGLNGNALTKSSQTDNSYQLNARLNYDKSFGEHSVKAMFIYEQAEANRDFFTGTRRNLLSPDVQQLFATSPRIEDRDYTGQGFEVGRLSYISSVSYNYSERYFLSTSVRQDASVAFIPGKRYGTFPSISAGWIVTEENFFKDQRIIDFMKIRGSYGTTGIDNITGGNEYPAYSYLTGYTVQTPANSYVFGDANASATVINVGGFPSVDATWDKTNTYNFGADLGFLKNKLTASFEVFKNHRYDLFAQRISIVPVELGAAPPRVNYGIIDVKGFEFSLNYKGSVRDFTYSAGFNIGMAQDKLIQYDENPLRAYNKLTGYNSDRIQGYIADDIIRTQSQLDALISKGYKFNNNLPYLGMVLLRDIRGNATIDPKGNTPDGVVTPDDITWIGKHSSSPINYGLSLSFSYKGFSLQSFVQGLEGFQKMIPATGKFYFDNVGEGGWATWNDAFEPDTNPNGKMPRFVSSGANGDPTGQNSTFWLRNAGFARLKNLNLAYQIPQKMTKKAGIKGASVFYNGSNLFFIYSHIKEFDPELQGEGLPINRTHSVGIQLSF
jgi:TonB-linked SusC/RagA family outer membrane protein